MVQRIQWEDRYAMDIQSVIQTAVNAVDGVDTQSGEEKAGILLNSHPHLDPAPNIIDTEKVSGSASRTDGSGKEFQQGTKEPTFALDFDAIAKPLYLPLHLFGQKGSLNENGNTTTKWFYPYSYEGGPSAAEIFGTFVRSLAPDGTAESHRAVGAICNSVSFSSEVNAALNISAEMMAREIEINRDTINDNFDISSDSVLLWQNATTHISDGVAAPVAFDCDGFSLTLTNNPIRKFYANQVTQKFLMGKIVGEGSIKIPWSPGSAAGAFEDNAMLAKFVSGTPTRFSFFWGAKYPTANNELSLNFIARYTGAPVGQDEDEIITDLSFQIVERVFLDSRTTGNNNITGFGSVGNPVIDSIIVAGGQIDGNVFPGDFALFPGAVEQDTKFLIDDVGTPAVDDIHLTSTPTTPGSSEMIIISQPFNIGLNDNIVRADVS